MSRKNNNVRYEEAYARVQAGEKVTRVLREMRLPASAYYLWLRRGGGNGQVKHYRANGATEEQTFTPPGLLSWNGLLSYLKLLVGSQVDERWINEVARMWGKTNQFQLPTQALKGLRQIIKEAA